MPGLLFFQQVADFGQQLYVGGWSRRSRGRFGLFFPVESVDQFDEQEDCKSDDDEVESRLKKIPVVNRHGRDDFARCGCLGLLECDAQIGEIDSADQHADRRHDDIGYQRRDDFAEGRTDYDTDGQIDHIAPHGELLEFVYEFAFHNTRF